MTPESVTAILIGLGIACGCLYFVAFCFRPPSLAKSVIKVLSVTPLACASWAMGAPGLLTFALGASSAGDLFLSRKGDSAFAIGAVFFGLAHLAYIRLMAPGGLDVSWTLPTYCILGLAAVMTILILINADSMRVVAIGYIAILTTLGLVAVQLPDELALARGAAAMFILSDTVLGLDRFVLSLGPAARVGVSYLIWGTYFAATLLFFLAFALL